METDFPEDDIIPCYERAVDVIAIDGKLPRTSRRFPGQNPRDGVIGPVIRTHSDSFAIDHFVRLNVDLSLPRM